MVKIPHFMVKNPLILVTNSNWSATETVFVAAGHLLQDIEMLQLGRDEVHFEGQEVA